ncbi:unnamed protein product, partial [Musa banksii]
LSVLRRRKGHQQRHEWRRGGGNAPRTNLGPRRNRRSSAPLPRRCLLPPSPAMLHREFPLRW